MRLAEFVSRNMEPILVQWEAFAATLLPAACSMSARDLRDHAQQILEAVVVDLGTPQTREQQAAKSQGRAPAPVPPDETAAQSHAVLRASSGFDIRQLAAEYRALRASVLRLWMDACAPAPPHVDDMIRFNEAIDQALAESIGHFSAKVEQSRNLLLGMLSHDMRSPLQAIQATAAYLARLDAGDAVSVAAQRLIDSGAQVQALLDDLTDFNRTNLGLGIPVDRKAVDLGRTCASEVALLRTANPQRRIELSVEGDCSGEWDGRRVQQLLGNLIVNALKHGAFDAPVQVRVEGRAADVRVEVANAGARIPSGMLGHLFDPLSRGPATGTEPGLGLGLYIVHEIAKAHGGSVEAHSTDDGTVFVTSLPK
jgi:signal transduction histidine kinase